MSPRQIAEEIRLLLKSGGSAKRAAGVQWFFKDKIQSCGWRTADLRRSMRQLRKQILREHGPEILVQVADELFAGTVLEEKTAAVLLLENLDTQFGDREFRMFEAWLERISSWSDHDGWCII